jgi:hypothetical protein
VKTTDRYSPVALRYGLLLVVVCLALYGCGPSLVRVMKEDPRDNTRYLRLSSAELAGEAVVYRGGRRLPVSLPHQLQSGDVIETGPDAVAVIRLQEGNEIILDSNTRVRLGSFFVEFGRILSRVRGFFEAESENVTAGVEGTEFVFDVRPDRSVAVTVLAGTVVCRPKTRSWQVRLNQGEFFYSQYPNLVDPGKRSATPSELDDIRRWIRKIEGSTGSPTPLVDRSGYCCSGGRVSRSTAEACRGVFTTTETEAYRYCPDAQPGYCCRDGKVTETSRSQCSGSFFTDHDEAMRNCQPKPESGYCCMSGKVFSSTRDNCRGKFFLDYDEAMRNCQPKPESGFCCMSGKVFQSTRENCKGKFFLDEAQARNACRSIAPERRYFPRDVIRPQPTQPSEPVIR